VAGIKPSNARGSRHPRNGVDFPWLGTVGV
jgi:hypothetical protein